MDKDYHKENEEQILQYIRCKIDKNTSRKLLISYLCFGSEREESSQFAEHPRHHPMIWSLPPDPFVVRLDKPPRNERKTLIIQSQSIHQARKIRERKRERKRERDRH